MFPRIYYLDVIDVIMTKTGYAVTQIVSLWCECVQDVKNQKTLRTTYRINENFTKALSSMTLHCGS